MKVTGAGRLHPLYEQRELDRMLEQMLPGSGDGRSLERRIEESPWTDRLPRPPRSHHDDQRMIVPPLDDMGGAYDPTISPDQVHPDMYRHREDEARLMQNPQLLAMANMLGGMPPMDQQKQPQGMMSLGAKDPFSSAVRGPQPLPISMAGALPVGSGSEIGMTMGEPVGGMSTGVRPVSTVQPMPVNTGTTAATGGPPTDAMQSGQTPFTPMTPEFNDALSSQTPFAPVPPLLDEMMFRSGRG